MGNNKNTIITPPETPKSTGTHDHTLGTKLSSYFLVQRRASDFGEVSPPSERSASDRLTKSPERIAEERQQDLRPQVDHNGSVPSPASNNQRVLEWNDSNTRVASPSTFDSGRSHPADPPRPPREGLEWVWFPEGYWAEREIRVTPAAQQEKRPKWWNIAVDRTSSSARKNETSEGSEFSRMRFGNLIPRKGSSNKSTLHVSPGTSSRSPRSSVNDYDSRRNSHPPNIRSPSHNPPGERNPDEEQLGLYCRTKKTIKSRFMQNTVVTDNSYVHQMKGKRLASRTTVLLEGTSLYFDRVQRDRCAMSSTAGTSVTPSAQSVASRQRFGVAPWHRRSSHESILSVSSSVFRLLRGKPPAPTPNPDFRYEAKDGKSYSKVDITSPDPVEPSFLPSEAKRVTTPPLFPGSPSVQPRGFFFDLQLPVDDDKVAKKGSSSQGSSSHDHTTIRSKDTISPNREWWEVDTKHESTGNKYAHIVYPQSQRTDVPDTSFVLNLPEHLPNSPLCPKNPMHKDGGNGICVYHGRKRSVKLRNSARADSQESEMIESETTPFRLRTYTA